LQFSNLLTNLVRNFITNFDNLMRNFRIWLAGFQSTWWSRVYSSQIPNQSTVNYKLHAVFVFCITSLFELLSSTLGEQQKISFVRLLYKIFKFELFSVGFGWNKEQSWWFKDGTSRNFVLSFRLSRDYRQVYSLILFVVNYH
jgi:hypothetical protein